MRSTLVGALPRAGASAFASRAERRIVPIGERTSVRVELDRPSQRTREAVLLLHGLAGSSESSYVVGTARKAVARGIAAARMNARGCGGTGALTKETYHGDETDDPLGVARFLVEQEGFERVHLVGFSVGGNQILALAARLSPAPPPWLGRTVTLCPCIDFEASARELERDAVRRAIGRVFVRRLAAVLKDRVRAGDPVDISGIDRIRSVRAFDERFTAPLSGFADAADYYRRASMVHRLEEIRVPTWILAARDDPLVPFDAFEHLETEAGAIRLLASEYGGHVAFLARAPSPGPLGPDLDRRWAENRIVDLLRSGCGEAPPVASW